MCAASTLGITLQVELLRIVASIGREVVVTVNAVMDSTMENVQRNVVIDIDAVLVARKIHFDLSLARAQIDFWVFVSNAQNEERAHPPAGDTSVRFSRS